ncbi:hypothetical protein BGX21_007830 [Mortierella sp. AD011]|nr:hypothetical protein BGX20_007419 [Mortierella sp. AD010]KAF9398407.1 hypothetical protein BGX21_007830 [Mortierella sp. AD011]
MQRHQRHHNEEQGSPSHSTSPPSLSGYPNSRIVDIAAIELEKENIQPIRQGRSAQVLSRLFATQRDDRAHELELHHQHFQAELERADELKDPMDVYMRYVTWTIENYPQGGAQGHDSRLVSLLEQAIENFKDDERYKNDPRFVKLLVIYSEKVEFPMDVFNFMETNRIGSEISMYYEEHADYLESREEFDKAKDVFLLGIHRRARPFGRLKRLFEEFERRAELYQQELERKAMEDLESEQLLQRPRPPEPATVQSAGRRVLGNKISGSESRHANETTRGYVPIGSSSSSASATSSRTSALSNYKRPNAKLEVFSDQSSQPSSSGRTKPKTDHHPSQENTPWKDLGADHVRRKENLREATSWKGTRLTAEDTLPRQPQPRLQVWHDSENTDSESVLVSEKASALPETTTNQGHMGSALSFGTNVPNFQESKKDIVVPHPEPAHPPTMSYSTAPPHTIPSNKQDSRFPVTISDRGGQERLMLDLKQIYSNGEEFSVEEIKARCSLYKFDGPAVKVSAALRPKPDDSNHSSVSHSFMDNHNSNHYSHDIPRTPSPQHINHDNLEEGDQFSVSTKPLLPKSPSDEEREQFGFRRRLTTSSPTLHTKHASAEMNKTFSDRSRARKSIDSLWSNDDNKDVNEDELDRFTMAYSIPSAPWVLPLSSQEFLENEIQNESEDEDDRDIEGRTEKFIRRLEQGFASTITQDIEALKRRHAQEDETRLSFRSNKRSSSRFDASRRQSDITMAIQQRFQQTQQHGQGSEGAVGSDTTGKRPSIPYPRSSLGQSRLSGGRLVDERRTENDLKDCSRGKDINEPRTRPFQVFRDGVGNLDSELNVPMLEDEAPPPFLDHEEVL